MRKAVTLEWESIRARLAASEAALQRAIAPDSQALETIFAERARQFAVTAETAAETDRQLPILRFRIASEYFAIALASIRQVGRLTHCRPVPGGPAILAGVMHHGGEIRSVIDLGRLLAESAVVSRSGYFIHVFSEARELQFRVDELDEVRRISLDEAGLEPGARFGIPVHWIKACLADGTIVLCADALCASCGSNSQEAPASAAARSQGHLSVTSA